MIKTKEDLKKYLAMDRFAYNTNRKRPKFYGDEIWKYLMALRKHEYYTNINKGAFTGVFRKYYSFKHRSLGMKLGYDIPINTCGGVKTIPSWPYHHSSERKNR